MRVRTLGVVVALSLAAGACLPDVDLECKRCRTSSECGSELRCTREVCVPENADPVTFCTNVTFPPPPDAGPRPDTGPAPDAGPRPDLGFIDGAVPDTGEMQMNPDAGMMTTPDSGADPCLSPPGNVPTGFAAVTSPTMENLNAVWARCPNDVWAVGASGYVARWDGMSWTRIPNTVGDTLNAVWGSGKDDVWIVGDGNRVLHWNGFQLQDSQLTAAGGFKLNEVWGFAANNFYVLGDAKRVYRYNGSGFSDERVAVTGGGDMLAVWGANPDDVWVAGGEGGAASNSSLAHYHGGRWEVITMDYRRPFAGVSGTATNDVYFVFYTSSQIIHWDGNQLEILAEGSPLGFNYNILFFPPMTGYLIGQGLAMYDGTQWATVSHGGGNSTLAGIGASGPTDIWIVGRSGTILHGP